MPTLLTLHTNTLRVTMSSNVLPQAALFMVVPRNPTVAASAPMKLAFSSVVSRRPILLPNSYFRSILGPKNRSFVVRAEAEEGAAEAEPPAASSEDSEELAADASETEAEGEVESESEPQAEAEVEKTPPKPRIKLGDIMGILNQKAIEASDDVRPTPDIRVGDVVEIKLEVPENRRRLSVYKGIVISKQNAGIHTTIRIRRIIAGIGVEIVFPVYSPNIKEIKVMSHRKVRRARLYYLRDKLPRLSTFK